LDGTARPRHLWPATPSILELSRAALSSKTEARSANIYFRVIYLCHERPDLLEFETEIVARRPGAVLLARSALHPGGGGQVSDRATLEYRAGVVEIVGVQAEGDHHWHLLGADVDIEGPVRVRIDAAFRSRVAQLHTDTHILNALVFPQFAGALVTGAERKSTATVRRAWTSISPARTTIGSAAWNPRSTR